MIQTKKQVQHLPLAAPRPLRGALVARGKERGKHGNNYSPRRQARPSQPYCHATL